MNRGNASAHIMAIGLAPGGAAIGAGQAFHGNSFSRLRAWFTEAGYPLSEKQLRAAIYLTSMIKCGARFDTASQRRGMWGHCQSFLWRQLQLVRPKLVLLLGGEVVSTVLRRRESLTDLVAKSWPTTDAFPDELFPPLEATSRWLVMPHPSGLSRLMNDAAVHRRVVDSLAIELRRIGFGELEEH